jgi:hypothetical protein
MTGSSFLLFMVAFGDSLATPWAKEWPQKKDANS